MNMNNDPTPNETSRHQDAHSPALSERRNAPYFVAHPCPQQKSADAEAAADSLVEGSAGWFPDMITSPDE